jgi:large subunit ribosomal protein L28
LEFNLFMIKFDVKRMEVFVSRSCDICKKHTVFGNKISHSHRKTRRKWFPNLLSMKALINGEVKKTKICAKCLKAGKVQKVV